MKIILTENQLSNTIIQFIKKDDWIDTSEMVGLDAEDFAQVFFNNDPMEFLNIFNDLDVVHPEQTSPLIIFRYEQGKNLMIYHKDTKTNILEISYPHIWLFLERGFSLSNKKIKGLIEKWFQKTFNLKVDSVYLRHYMLTRYN
jgi:hypothetical protein